MKFLGPSAKPKLVIINHEDFDEWGADHFWSEYSYTAGEMNVSYFTLDHSLLLGDLQYCHDMLEVLPIGSSASYSVEQAIEEHVAGWCSCCQGEED